VNPGTEQANDDIIVGAPLVFSFLWWKQKHCCGAACRVSSCQNLTL